MSVAIQRILPAFATHNPHIRHAAKRIFSLAAVFDFAEHPNIEYDMVAVERQRQLLASILLWFFRETMNLFI